MIRLMASRRGKINRPLRQVKAAVTQARQSARLKVARFSLPPLKE
jgi:hypothetical protein